MKKTWFRTLLLIVLASILLFFSIGIPGRSKHLRPSSKTEWIITLSTNTLIDMQIARNKIEDSGVRIKSVFPPNTFIAEIPNSIMVDINSLKFVKYVKAKPEEKESRLNKEKKIKSFRDKVIFPKDLPKTDAERIRKNQEYLERWRQRKKLQELNNEKKILSWLIISSLAYASVEDESGFGKAYGAGYYDTSLYMAGDIAVGIFFVPGSKGDWTSEEIDEVFNQTCNALDQFIDDEPNADIVFTFIKEVDEQGIPAEPPYTEEDKLDYVNDIRNIYNTHWAYMIIIEKGDGTPYAYIFGPSVQLYTSYLGDGFVVRHETMHIFGAADQYPQAQVSPIMQCGYLNVVNANSWYKDTNGYFFGYGERNDDIMRARVYTYPLETRQYW